MSDDRWFSIARTVLLTGAGFTKTFGGYLGDEMWDLVFSQPEIRKSPSLRQRMLEEFDYEAIYADVMESKRFSANEKSLLKTSIRRAYQRLHEEVCQHDSSHRAAAFAVCRSFISRFAGKEYNERGFFFTLNQDLLVETYYSQANSILLIPGLRSNRWFTGPGDGRIADAERVLLPVGESVRNLETSFWRKNSERLAYVKLHGSYDWHSRAGNDALVIGNQKSKAIQDEPLLQWYFSLFSEVLNAPERILVVIGYGFRDRHINDVIVNAIKTAGLRLYIVSPKSPKEFHDMIDPIAGTVGQLFPDGGHLWGAIYGYYRGVVTELFDENRVDLPRRGMEFFKDLSLA